MFVMKKTSTYFWPVKVSRPADAGKQEVSTFDVEFKSISQSRLQELLNDDNASDIAFAREVVIGWRGIQNENQAEIPFSEGAFNDLLEISGVAAGISVAYLESVSQAKRKN